VLDAGSRVVGRSKFRMRQRSRQDEQCQGCRVVHDVMCIVTLAGRDGARRVADMACVCALAPMA
jgi:hypothetical protein